MAITSGTHTVGSGGDYATWALALADIGSPLVGDLTLNQISTITETALSDVASLDLDGFTLLLDSTTPHGGSPIAGNEINLTAFISQAAPIMRINILSTSGAGSEVEVRNLRFRTNPSFPTAQPALRIQGPSNNTNTTIFVHDILIDGDLKRQGLDVSGVSVQIWNIQAWRCVDVGIDYHFNGVSGSGRMENCTAYAGDDVGIIYTKSNLVTLKNLLSLDNTGLDFEQLDLGGFFPSRNSLASSDTTATGTNAITLVTTADEVESVSDASADFLKLKVSVGDDIHTSGTTPAISGNTAGIRGDQRPDGSSNISIGADQFATPDDDSSTSSTSFDSSSSTSTTSTSSTSTTSTSFDSSSSTSTSSTSTSSTSFDSSSSTSTSSTSTTSTSSTSTTSTSTTSTSSTSFSTSSFNDSSTSTSSTSSTSTTSTSSTSTTSTSSTSTSSTSTTSTSTTSTSTTSTSSTSTTSISTSSTSTSSTSTSSTSTTSTTSTSTTSTTSTSSTSTSSTSSTSTTSTSSTSTTSTSTTSTSSTSTTSSTSESSTSTTSTSSTSTTSTSTTSTSSTSTTSTSSTSITSTSTSSTSSFDLRFEIIFLNVIHITNVSKFTVVIGVNRPKSRSHIFNKSGPIRIAPGDTLMIENSRISRGQIRNLLKLKTIKVLSRRQRVIVEL